MMMMIDSGVICREGRTYMPYGKDGTSASMKGYFTAAFRLVVASRSEIHFRKPAPYIINGRVGEL